jgi:hypothetical protein
MHPSKGTSHGYFTKCNFVEKHSVVVLSNTIRDEGLKLVVEVEEIDLTIFSLVTIAAHTAWSLKVISQNCQPTSKSHSLRCKPYTTDVKRSDVLTPHSVIRYGSRHPQSEKGSWLNFQYGLTFAPVVYSH